MSTQTNTWTASPFQNEELMIQEEQALPSIPDWPSIWSTTEPEPTKIEDNASNNT